MRRTLAVLLAAGLLAAAGCGDDDDEAQTTPEPATTGESSGGGGGGGGGTSNPVSLTEFKIDPANPSLKAGKATFEITNDGNLPHALEIEGNGEEFVSDTLNGKGDSTTLDVELKAGEYEWYCPIGNHKAQGMDGTLTVEGGSGGEGDGASSSSSGGGGAGGGY